MDKPEKVEIETRDRYRYALSIPTRWMDNDIYGHVNNVVYYSFFDTIVNDYLIREGKLDIAGGPVIGVVVETMCRYRKSVAFPEVVDCMLRVGKIGRSSIRFEIGVFRRGEDEASAWGHFVHVFVDRESRKPAPIPEPIKNALEKIDYSMTSSSDKSAQQRKPVE
jgi:acyl-CoA thioester hydrolase